MSKGVEVIRALHGVTSRRVLGTTKPNAVAYVGAARAVTIGGKQCIIVADDQFAMKEITDSLGTAFKTTIKHTHPTIVAVVRADAVTLADSGWAPRSDIKPEDFDEDDL